MSTNPALLMTLDRACGVPLHRQIEVSVREAIRAGRLTAGSTIPPSRVLAADLGVSRGVVVEAYEQLGAEGYLLGRVGGSTQVVGGVSAGVAAAPAVLPTAPPAKAPLRYDLSYGRADVAHFPRAAWMRALRSALTNAPNDAFGYPAGPGMPHLRGALAEYLNRVRGTSAEAGNVIVCTGYAQGVGLVIQTLAAAGAARLAVEDPSSGDDAVPIARAAGLEVIGIPVEEDGISVDALRASNADAVILTPAHQWPTGAVLSAAKRAAIIAWAVERDAVIIEDDYDAEYRYDGSPVGAMQGLAPDRVVYGGSASKTLAPGIRLGWLIAPPHLSKALADAKISADRGSPALEQLALADLIRRGEIDRHLRRMRPVYRRRRDVLLASLRTHLPELRPSGISAGMHLLTWLPDELSEEVLIARAAAAGIRLDALAPYRLTPGGPGGLVFGYAAINESAIPGAIRELASAIR
ncbi:MAG TPA: PLP-dependent aminotransferase family protein [Frankiaceae bacterium]|nr:PLP-dependent aminotransferase family protein [Frankiaceae bacterium]